MIRTIFSITIIAFVFGASASAADGWGSVSGKIIWKGDVPERQILHNRVRRLRTAKFVPLTMSTGMT
jgi:hypothetical protein